jgi:hypothetical protein
MSAVSTRDISLQDRVLTTVQVGLTSVVLLIDRLPLCGVLLLAPHLPSIGLSVLAMIGPRSDAALLSGRTMVPQAAPLEPILSSLAHTLVTKAERGSDYKLQV